MKNAALVLMIILCAACNADSDAAYPAPVRYTPTDEPAPAVDVRATAVHQRFDLYDELLEPGWCLPLEYVANTQDATLVMAVCEIADGVQAIKAITPVECRRVGEYVLCRY